MRTVTVLLGALLALLLIGVAWALWPHAVIEDGSVAVTMCPDCRETFLTLIKGGGTIECALYDVGTETGAALKAAHADVITDDETSPAYGTRIKEAGLMHNKFCVINGSVVTSGSYNPTDGGELNRNNLVVIHSQTLARNYDKEFHAIKDYASRGGVSHTVTLTSHVSGENGTRIDNYFCPEDNCEDHVVAELQAAQHDVTFLTFSFTSDAIGKTLLADKARGVTVQGVCDGGQMRSEQQYTECPALDAKLWSGPALLHHKVFIIDHETVITGSYNPTASGDHKNRENIVIIHSDAIAAQYLAEYQEIAQASAPEAP